MQDAGVPIIPGTTDPVGSVEELLELGESIGYPLLIKAAAGGGGKGMEIVEAPDGAAKAFETAQRQGQSYFANPDVYVEKLIVDPRHIEVQVLADGARQRHPPRRARLHDPAPPSEARRGDAVAGGGRRAPRADRRDRRRRGARGGLPLGRDDRGSAHRRRRLLLHGDEHAHPGRAHGDRDGHRHRPRARAGADRARPAALGHAGRGRAARPRDRVPDQRGGRVARVPADAGARHRLSRAGRAGRPRRLRASPRGTRSRASTTR